MKLYNITESIIKTNNLITNDTFIKSFISSYKNPVLKYMIPNTSTFVDTDLIKMSSILDCEIITNRAIFSPKIGKNYLIIDNKIIDLKLEINITETSFKKEVDQFEVLINQEVYNKEINQAIFNLQDKNGGNNAPTIKLFFQSIKNYCVKNGVDLSLFTSFIGVNIRPLLILPPTDTTYYVYLKNQYRRYNEDFDIEYKFDNLDLLLDAPAFKTMKLSNGSIYIRLVDEIDLYKEGGDQDYIDAYFKFVEYILSINKK